MVSFLGGANSSLISLATPRTLFSSIGSVSGCNGGKNCRHLQKAEAIAELSLSVFYLLDVAAEIFRTLSPVVILLVEIAVEDHRNLFSSC